MGTYQIEVVSVPDTSRKTSVGVSARVEAVNVRDRFNGIVRDIDGGTGLPVYQLRELV